MTSICPIHPDCRNSFKKKAIPSPRAIQLYVEKKMQEESLGYMEFIARTGIAENSLLRILKGTLTRPRIEIINRITKAFGDSTEDVFQCDDGKQTENLTKRGQRNPRPLNGDLQHLGVFIKTRCLEKFMTHSDLSRKVRIAEKTLKDIINHKYRTIRADHFDKLSEILEFTVEDVRAFNPEKDTFTITRSGLGQFILAQAAQKNWSHKQLRQAFDTTDIDFHQMAISDDARSEQIHMPTLQKACDLFDSTPRSVANWSETNKNSVPKKSSQRRSNHGIKISLVALPF